MNPILENRIRTILGPSFVPIKKKHIQFFDYTVIKKYEYEKYGDDIQVELEKAKAMEKVCASNNIVIAKSLEIDYENHTIEYQKISEVRKIKSHFIDVINKTTSIADGKNLQYLSGQALGSIHRDLNLSSKNIWKPNDTIEKSIEKIEGKKFSKVFGGTPKVFLHCDYGFANVGYKGESEYEIVIFDPSPNRYMTTTANEFGTIYVDIGVYFSGLNGRIPLKYYKKNISWELLSELKDSFCEGYTSVTGLEIDQHKAELMGYGGLSALYDMYENRLSKRLKMGLIYNRLKGNEFWKR